MAYIGSCRFCGGQTLDTDVHPECAVAELEDLIYRFQQELNGEGENLIPILDEIVARKCLGKAQFEERQLQQRIVESQKQSEEFLRQLAVSRAATDAGAEFDKKRLQQSPGQPSVGQNLFGHKVAEGGDDGP